MLPVTRGNGAAVANYLNPSNAGFQEVGNAEYVDKSGLIELVNRTIRTPLSGVKVSDTKFSGNHAASCTSSKPDSNLSKNSSISSAVLLQPTLK